ncbi:MAG: HAD-IIIA family hydrolase [Lachnospiraceae bacterium]|nr:HAD-IIIA family hydrolase [Lachnospiraceae bacterium]
MKAVIMAGGRGTRISSVASDIPKPMISIDSRPVLEHEIICLKEQGFTDLIITVSYMADKIMEYFGNGSSWKVNIQYFVEEKPLGNAGALYELGLSEDFLLINADSIFNIDINRFVNYHKYNNGLATILTHPNSHPFDSGLIFATEGHVVEKWLGKHDDRPQWYKNRVNAGIHILSPKLLEKRPEKEKIDLDSDILKPLAGTGRLICYDSPEYIKDMGTPERYQQVCIDFKNGIPQKKCLKEKQKAIFLDRDGTINKYVGFLRNIDDFELLPNVSEAIRMINQSEYLAIVVTNQPVIARGEVTYEELNMIHRKMDTLLGKHGAYIDGLYFCPHHPDKGYVGEISELKIRCSCRKPGSGMLLAAANDFNIDLSKSWIIGDSDNDIKAGENAGCNTMKIDTNGSIFNCVERIINGQ